MGYPNPMVVVDPEGGAVEMRGSSRCERVDVNMGGPNTNFQIAEGFEIIHSFTVVGLTGAVVPTIRTDSVNNPAVPTLLGEIRDNLHIRGGLFISHAGGGGIVTYEIHGR